MKYFLTIIFIILFSCTNDQIECISAYRNWEPFELSKDAALVSKLFTPSTFHNRFKGFRHKTYSYNLNNKKVEYIIGDCELDALTHFYGNLLYKDKYGVIITGLAGLVNELYGSIILGNTWKSQKIDFQNNYSGLINYGPKQLEALKILLKGDIISDSTFKDFLAYGLQNTNTPPRTERFWRPWRSW